MKIMFFINCGKTIGYMKKFWRTNDDAIINIIYWRFSLNSDIIYPLTDFTWGVYFEKVKVISLSSFCPDAFFKKSLDYALLIRLFKLLEFPELSSIESKWFVCLMPIVFKMTLSSVLLFSYF